MDRRLLDLIGDAYAVLDLDGFRYALLQALLEAVPADRRVRPQRIDP
ncbi:MAG TPA: hypothetical protein VNB64_05265 [Solirubrobacteraceae bacterium]|nr:hypothetical protein [Solirubrobacteraceae bacterium]